MRRQKNSTKSARQSPALISPAEAYHLLRERFGHRGWWPGDTAFEICIGAILTQNVAWRNVELAIANLKAAGALGPRKMRQLAPAALGDLIRPAGYFNMKAARLRTFLDHVAQHHRGSVRRMLDGEMPGLRGELLAINGIGKETADSMICYAKPFPLVVIDAYTRRWAYRMGWQSRGDVDYDALQEFFTAALPGFDADTLGDFHAQIVHLAKDFCRKTAPRCASCPLYRQCPRIGVSA